MRKIGRKLFCIACVLLFLGIYLQRSITNYLLPAVPMETPTRGSLVEQVEISSRVSGKTLRFRCEGEGIVEQIFLRPGERAERCSAVLRFYPPQIEEQRARETDPAVLAWLNAVAEDDYLIRMPEAGYVSEILVEVDQRILRYDTILTYESLADEDIAIRFTASADSFLRVQDSVTVRAEVETERGTAILSRSAVITTREVQGGNTHFTAVPCSFEDYPLRCGDRVRIQIQKSVFGECIVPASALIPHPDLEEYYTIRFAQPMEGDRYNGRYTVVQANARLLYWLGEKAILDYKVPEGRLVIVSTESHPTGTTVRRAGEW